MAKIDAKDAINVARAMCEALGTDPDQMVPETGYPGARLIPRWHKEMEFAIRHIAAHDILTSKETPP